MKPYRQSSRYVWEHTRDVREAIAIAKIVDTSDEVNSIASTLRRYSNEMRAYIRGDYNGYEDIS